MPRPPILPTIDWKGVFESGKTYADWIGLREEPENCDRMEALRAEIAIEPHVVGFLSGLARPVHVVAIAEDWCGDVVRHVPVLRRLEEQAPQLRVRFVSREQHPDVFVRFLTNGGEAIPKFVFLSDQFVECGSWGPMPEACRELVARGKACGNVAAAREKVSALYEANIDRRWTVEDLVHLVDVASTAAP
jgi:hypothetical protein